MKRESFIFYHSYAEALQELSDKQRLHLFDAIIAYALYGADITLTGVEKGMFALIRPQIDANNQKYENGCKGAEYGKRGGRPHKDKSCENPKGVNSENPDKTPNENENVNVNENENVNVNVNENVNVKAPQSVAASLTRFVRPTLEEISAYCQERNNNVDPQAFFDFYESKGWRVGNQAMKDWKAAVRTWERRSVDRNKPIAIAEASQYTAEDLERYRRMEEE